MLRDAREYDARDNSEKKIEIKGTHQAAPDINLQE